MLEIDTGYQAAVLSHLARKIYTIEKLYKLHEVTDRLLKEQGYNNIESRCSNGNNGWYEKAPFDAIIVTAATPHISPALIEQLKPGGRMVIPVGLPHMLQELMLLTKAADGSTKTDAILLVSFVPLAVSDDDSHPT